MDFKALMIGDVPQEKRGTERSYGK